MSSNILYDEVNDNLYILVYKLGRGSYAIVWFAIELTKFIQTIKNNKINISYKALKIHNSEDFEEGILETKINSILKDNTGKKTEYINYPLSHFIYNEDIVIVVYNVAIGSLYDISKMFDRKLPLDFVKKIIPQMKEAINFVHHCGYIHTDIKPENFLLTGLTKFQDDIIKFVKKYDLYRKFKLTKKRYITKKNMMEIIKEPIYNMLDELAIQFDIFDNINNFNSENNDSEDNVLEDS